VKLLSRIAGLSSARRRLLARAFALLVWFRFALLAVPVATLNRRIEAGAGKVTPRFTPRDAAWAVRAVAGRLPGTHCLARALALHALLRRAGFDSELRVGVARAGDYGIAAHAWVVCAGREIEGEPSAGAYVAFGALPR
jgi:hypothetical protein